MFAASIKNSLELSVFGVAQPKREGADIIPPEKLDLVIVPGVAFDKGKNRLGFGMGYYDSFLSNTKAYRLALAYDFQIVESIPVSEHDQKMDSIMTPEQYLL
jgi:5-formyltetrahydrofolate cyclo-ligase